MKTKALLFAICSLPFAILASSISGHQAFGALRFGTPSKEADQIFRQMHHAKDPHQMTAAEARTKFVTNGTMKISRLEDYDRAMPVYIYYRGEPFVTEVTMESNAALAGGYDGLKSAWEALQDIGDCKFARKSEKGNFCPMATVDAAALDEVTHRKTVVTDVWETEGVRIELAVQYLDPATMAYLTGAPPRYRVALIAKEIAPTK